MTHRVRGGVGAKSLLALGVSVLLLAGWWLSAPDDASDAPRPGNASEMRAEARVQSPEVDSNAAEAASARSARERSRVSGETSDASGLRPRFLGTPGGQVLGRFVLAAKRDSALAAPNEAIHLELIGRDRFTRDVRQDLEIANDSFVIDVAVAGGYSLLARTTSGEFGAAIDGIECRDGGVVDLGAIELRKTLGFSGRVVAERGLPVRDASVRAGSSTATSDVDGIFTLTHAPEGLAAIDVSAAGFVSETVSLAERGRLGDLSASNFVIELVRQVSVAGIVLDASDQPVPGAAIWLRGRTVATDARGRFALEAMDPRELLQSVAFVRHATAGHAEPSLTAESENVVRLTASAFAKLVLEPTSSFDPKARAILERFMSLPSGESRYFTDRALSARFVEPNLLFVGPLEADQKYYVDVETTRGEVGYAEFRTSGPELEVEEQALRLHPPLRLSGSAEAADGTPLVGASIVARPAQPLFVDERLPSAVARTDANGRFEFTRLRTAHLDLVVRHPGCAPFVTRVESNFDVVLKVPGHAALEVIFEGYDAALGPLVVEARNEATRDVLRATLTEVGVARFPELTPGRTQVAIRTDARTLRELEPSALVAEVELVVGEAAQVRFSARDIPAADLEIAVVDTSALPLPGLVVVAYGVDTPWRRTAITDDRGIAKLVRVPYGHASVTVDPVPEMHSEIGSGLRVSLDVNAPRAELRFVAAIGSLDITVVDAQGQPVDHAEIEIVFEREADRSFDAIDPTFTDAQGKLIFERLPAGAYRVRCPGRANEASCVVTDRQHSSLSIQLRN